MCREMRVVVLREMLGNREICWSLWDGKAVFEQTSNQIKNTIQKGIKVCGLAIGKNGELEPDLEGFYCTNIMQHRHSGNYTPMLDEGCMSNVFYICIGSHEENGVVVYDCISTKWERLVLDEASMKAYLKLGIVSAGVKEVDGKLVVADLEFKQEPPKEPEVVAEPVVEKVAEKPVEVLKEPKVEPKVVENPLEEHTVSVEIEKVKPDVKVDKKPEGEKPVQSAKVDTKPANKEKAVEKKK